MVLHEVLDINPLLHKYLVRSNSLLHEVLIYSQNELPSTGTISTISYRNEDTDPLNDTETTHGI